MTGTGVTFVFTGNIGGQHSLRSTNSAVALTAPTTGATAGIAIWIDRNSTTRGIDLTGGGTPTGAIYAPNADVSLSGHAGSPCTQLVVRSVATTGNVQLRHECDGTGVSDVGGGFRLVE